MDVWELGEYRVVGDWFSAGSAGSRSGPADLEELVGPRPLDVTRWADPDQVHDFFAGTGRTVCHDWRATVRIPFADPDHAVEAMRRLCGPRIVVLSQLDDATAERAARILRDHLDEHSEPTSAGIDLLAHYTVTHLS